MNTSFSFQALSSEKVNTESGSRPVGPSQPPALVLNRLEYSLTFAYRVKSKLLTGPIFGEAYTTYCNECGRNKQGLIREEVERFEEYKLRVEGLRMLLQLKGSS